MAPESKHPKIDTRNQATMIKASRYGAASMPVDKTINAVQFPEQLASNLPLPTASKAITASSAKSEPQQNKASSDAPYYPFWLLFNLGLFCQGAAFLLGYVTYLCIFFDKGAVWPHQMLFMLIASIVKFGSRMFVGGNKADTEMPTTPSPWDSKPILSIFFTDRYLGGSPHYELAVFAAGFNVVGVLINVLMWAAVKCMLKYCRHTTRPTIDDEKGITVAMINKNGKTGAAGSKLKKKRI